MQWKRLPTGPIGTNCYICLKGDKALIIDPGGNCEEIIQALNELQVQPQAILLTHAHFDHIGGVDSIRTMFGIPVYLHEEEWNWMADSRLNGSAYFPVEEITAKKPDKPISEGLLVIGEFQFEVRYTPGHSPGSVSFIDHDSKQIISGDVLFNMGIGRTDLPGGDEKTLYSSIKNVLYTLGEDYQVLPGHGEVTTIGDEKTNNPFVKG